MFNIEKGINPLFFVGIVVDKHDPINEGRVRVEVYGIHPTETQPSRLDILNIVEREDLPWAICVNGAYGALQAIPDEGEWVLGFFLDGREAQHPIVLGTIPGMNTEDYSAPTGSYVDTGVGDGFGGTTGPDGDGGGATPREPNPLSIAELEADPEWNAAMERILAEHPGLTREELYRIIDGESSFNPTETNALGSGATGLFQFMPNTARSLGTTTAEIQNMTPAQQLDLYNRYLTQNNYRGGPLGIMQAAPSFAGRPGNTVVYAVGTDAWELNPVWRPPGGGDITVDSINNYYATR